MPFSTEQHRQEQLIQQFEEIVRNKIHSVDLDNAYLARKLCMSEAGLYRLVKKHYASSPNHVIRKIRLQEACKILSQNFEATVSDVAYAVGFSHVGYFIRRYEELYGHKPGEYRRQTALC